MSEYIELQFEQTDNQTWVRINESPLGQLRGGFQAPFTSAQAATRLDAADVAGRQKEEGAALGTELYTALDQARVGEALRTAVNQARAQREQVILQLRFDEGAVTLAGLPWELLHDGRRHLLAAGAVDLTRYVTYSEGLVPLVAELPLRVLHVGASPTSLPSLDVAASEEALRAISGLVVERLPDPTYDGLLKRLETEPRVHVLHFDGHGDIVDGQSVLCFENEDGDVDPVDADALQNALYNQVALVVLNACQSSQLKDEMVTIFEGMAPALIQAGTPAVVGMQFPILDQSAIRFLGAFYGAITRGEPLTRAMTAARRWLYRQGSWYIPTLYLRSGDPAGQLFPPGQEPIQPVDAEAIRRPRLEGPDSESEVEALEKELEIHRRNLRLLRQQAAIYGAGAVPLHVFNQIQHEEKSIREIEGKLAR